MTCDDVKFSEFVVPFRLLTALVLLPLTEEQIQEPA